MRKLLVAIAITLALGGCSLTNAAVSPDSSPRTRVAAASAGYLVAQEGIKAYLLLPPCASTTLPTCKSAAVVTVLQKGNTTVSAALDYAETVVVTPGASNETIELAVGTALAAIKSFNTTRTNLGVK
jgi:uncharacterized protein YceK